MDVAVVYHDVVVVVEDVVADAVAQLELQAELLESPQDPACHPGSLNEWFSFEGRSVRHLVKKNIFNFLFSYGEFGDMYECRNKS